MASVKFFNEIEKLCASYVYFFKKLILHKALKILIFGIPNFSKMKYTALDSKTYVQNRKNFSKRLAKGGMAIFNANDEMPRSADGTYKFRQNSDLYYLSGIDQEQTVLVIFPDCPNPLYKEALFLRKTNEVIAVWEGHKYTMEEARLASGIQNIFWIEDFEKSLGMLMNMASKVYVNLNEHGRFSTDVPYRDLRFAQDIKKNYPAHEIMRSAPIMFDIRSIKSSAEIKAMQEAVDITEKAFRRVLKFTKPGVMEYEVEAEIIHEFIRNRATGHAYEPIIASGASACVLHYNDNNKECKKGDIMLMDFGAEYGNYAADLSRSIPVSGRFTKRQRDVYDAVLRVMRGATKMLKPGTTFVKYNEAVGKMMEKELVDLGLLKMAEVKKQNPKQPLYKKYFMHGTSHFLGLDVHDVGDFFAPMKAGNVFTCEPGIYIPEENLGIRLENDILITAKGPQDLMAKIPVDAEEIEDLMNKKK